jgi:hypothetical protein
MEFFRSLHNLLPSTYLLQNATMSHCHCACFRIFIEEEFNNWLPASTEEL